MLLVESVFSSTKFRRDAVPSGHSTDCATRFLLPMNDTRSNNISTITHRAHETDVSKLFQYIDS